MLNKSISVNKNFQTSVNIEFDINNHKKIDEYIPTSDICDVLKRYVDCALGRDKNRSTTLVGPYGKGKSFLILVLIYILNDYSDDAHFLNLTEKIETVDVDLAANIKKLREKRIRLLPLVVNSNYDDINQSFLISLKEALERDGLSGLIPNTTYDECRKLLLEWKKTEDKYAKIDTVCKKQISTSLSDIEKGLKEYNREAYQQFKRLYDCVTDGFELQPLLSDNIVKTFKSINNQLPSKGYSGLFIVFDEFSKFIESSIDGNTIKIIQDIAELANGSTNNQQVHLCCIMHKSLDSYFGASNTSFKTIEGRFKEIRFNRSLEENYQIISAAIRKEPGFDSAYDSYRNKHTEFYENITALKMFDTQNVEKDLFKGCFPLNPLTTYCLINLSEIVAQNERTLFTFLADNDDNSLNFFINNTKEVSLFDVSMVYDYFDQLFSKENERIRKIWYRTTTLCNLTDDDTKKKIIKVIALMNIIDNDKFIPSDKLISLCLGDYDIEEKINELLNERIIKRNYITSLLSFAPTSNKEIDTMVARIKGTAIKYETISTILNNFNYNKYVVSHKYNTEKKMIRYFRNYYFEEKEFINLASFSNVFKHEQADGLIVNVIRDSSSVNTINNIFRMIDDNRTILNQSKTEISKSDIEEIRTFRAFEQLLRTETINSEVVKEEAQMLYEEHFENVKNIIRNLFGQTISSEKLYETLSDAYSNTIIVNNEMFNKHNVNASYLKAIRNVTDCILSEQDVSKVYTSETSPEMTVFNAFNLDEEDLSGIVRYVINVIENSNGRKISINKLVNDLKNKPYGIRKGVIPMIFAYAIASFRKDHVLAYLQNKEIELSGSTLIEFTNGQKDYGLVLERGSAEQLDYLNAVIKVFHGKQGKTFQESVSNAVAAIRNWVLSLPTIVRDAQIKSNYAGFKPEIIQFKNLFVKFNIDNYKAIFKDIKSIFSEDSYTSIVEQLEIFDSEIDGTIEKFKAKCIEQIKTDFSQYNQGSLSSCLKEWKNTIASNNNDLFLEAKDKKLYEFIMENTSYDDISIYDKFSVLITGTYVEDWSNDKSNAIREYLSEFRKRIEEKDQKEETVNVANVKSFINENNETQLSSIGKLLLNNVRSAFDEYNDSITAEEKLAILSKLVDELIKGE